MKANFPFNLSTRFNPPIHKKVCIHLKTPRFAQTSLLTAYTLEGGGEKVPELVSLSNKTGLSQDLFLICHHHLFEMFTLRTEFGNTLLKKAKMCQLSQQSEKGA